MARRHGHRPKAMTAAQWNEKYPDGVQVRYRRPDGSTLETVTRSAAWELGHGEAVVLIEDVSGGVALWALEPAR